MRAWPSGAHDEATEEQTEARERMALLPSGWNVDVFYVKREIWTVRTGCFTSISKSHADVGFYSR